MAVDFIKTHLNLLQNTCRAFSRLQNCPQSKKNRRKKLAKDKTSLIRCDNLLLII